ncbi:DUF3383 family protein [Vibrio parahaemolyticus]
MSEPVSNIVDINVNIMGAALGTADLGIGAFIFQTDDEALAGTLDTWSSADDMRDKYVGADDLYNHALAWQSLSSKPFKTFSYYVAPAESHPAVQEHLAIEDKSDSKEIEPEFKSSGDEIRDAIIRTRTKAMRDNLALLNVKAGAGTPAEALAAARLQGFFYRPFIVETKDTDGKYIDITPADAIEVSNWSEANTARADFTCTDPAALDASVTDDLISSLSIYPNRRTSACYSSERTLATRLGAVMSMTDYAATGGYMDSEFSKVNLAAEDIGPTEINVLKTKGAYYNVSAQSVASETAGRTRNTKTFSQYSELISEVEAIDSLVIGLQAELDNAIENKGGGNNLGQTYDGQDYLNDVASRFCQRYFDNGFLGERTVIHPVTKKEVVAKGFINITKATDIDKLTAAERREYRAAPIVIYLYPAGSIHAIRVTLNVMY